MATRLRRLTIALIVGISSIKIAIHERKTQCNIRKHMHTAVRERILVPSGVV